MPKRFKVRTDSGTGPRYVLSQYIIYSSILPLRCDMIPAPKDAAPKLITSGPCADTAGWDAYTQYVAKELHGGRQTSGLIMPFPNVALDVPAANDFVAAQVKLDPTGISRPQMCVTPATTADDVRRRVKDEGFVGLKCYHVWSPVTPTFNVRPRHPRHPRHISHLTTFPPHHFPSLPTRSLTCAEQCFGGSFFSPVIFSR